jgi:hypothetical protein
MMKETPDDSDARSHSAPRQAAGTSAGPVGYGAGESSDWVRTRDGLKTKWVASVIAFWVSAAILAAVLFIEGKLNLILTSITLGMLVIGVWLKTRYQLHLRKDPDRH